MHQVELKVLEGRQQGKTIPLNVRQFLIGREQDCHLRPNSDLVSRHHCVFTVDDFTVRLRDLGSTNGTFVNGERIQGQVVLKPGDHVSVGKLSFEVVVRKEAPVAAPVAAGVGDSAGTAPRAGTATPPPGIDSSDTSLNVADTIEFPVAPPVVDDTAVLDTFPATETVQQPSQPQQPAFLPSMAYPPGYGMPQGYAMPGYAPGYPGGYAAPPGYPPGYGVPGGYMQPGYGMAPMMPGYGMPAQQPQSPDSGSGRAEPPPVVLPDPSETGAKAPAPPPPASPAAEGAAGAPPTVKPSDAAADIIRSHRNRRPT
jgi:pSer/pThr/pTyr-binding forkhead associated (FHA) protein